MSYITIYPLSKLKSSKVADKTNYPPASFVYNNVFLFDTTPLGGTGFATGVKPLPVTLNMMSITGVLVV